MLGTIFFQCVHGQEASENPVPQQKQSFSAATHRGSGRNPEPIGSLHCTDQLSAGSRRAKAGSFCTWRPLLALHNNVALFHDEKWSPSNCPEWVSNAPQWLCLPHQLDNVASPLCQEPHAGQDSER